MDHDGSGSPAQTARSRTRPLRGRIHASLHLARVASRAHIRFGGLKRKRVAPAKQFPAGAPGTRQEMIAVAVLRVVRACHQRGFGLHQRARPLRCARPQFGACMPLLEAAPEQGAQAGVQNIYGRRKGHGLIWGRLRAMRIMPVANTRLVGRRIVLALIHARKRMRPSIKS